MGNHSVRMRLQFQILRSNFLFRSTRSIEKSDLNIQAMAHVTLHGYDDFLRGVTFAPEERPNHTARIKLPQIANYREHMGSLDKYNTMKNRHIRRPEDPHELYRWAPTRNYELGFWRYNAPPQGGLVKEQLSWMFVRRQPQLVSEMSQFANKMRTQDKNFTMF